MSSTKCGAKNGPFICNRDAEHAGHHEDRSSTGGVAGWSNPNAGCTHTSALTKLEPNALEPYRAQSGALSTIVRQLRDVGVAADRAGNGACGPMSVEDCREFLNDVVNAVYDK